MDASILEPPGARREDRAPARRQVLLAAAIAAVALLAYVPAMRGGFFWDDDRFLYANKLIHAPDGLRRFWFTTEATDYFPLTSTLLWFEWRLWGNHPAGYHVINVLLHAACAVLIWRALRRLIPQVGTGAWLAGVLFSLHPVAAASAAWITEGKNTLSLTLFLASLLLYLRFDETAEHSVGTRQSAICNLQSRERSTAPLAFCNRLYLFSLFLFLLALLAKTSVVMLPAVLLLCAWWRRGRISRKDLLRSVPFFALSLALGLVTVWFQHHNAMKGAIVRPESIASRVAASGWIAWFYLFKVLLPAGLCVIYPRWAISGSRLLAFLPLALLLGGMALLWTRRKSWGRAPLFAVACFLVMLLPVLGFADMSIMEYSFAADHLQYPAMIAVIAFAAGILVRACPEGDRKACPEHSRRDAAAPAWRGRFGVLASAACAVVLGILTWHRASLYGDAQSLWQDNVNKNPAAWLAWNNLGWTFYRSGLDEKAVRCFDQAIERNRTYALALNNRAAALAGLGRFAAALEDCRRVIELKPGWASAYDTRGNVLVEMGRPAEAVADYDRAVAQDPHFADAYSNRALAHYRLKEYDKALEDVRRCRDLGGHPEPGFLKDLSEAAGRRD